MKTTALPDPLHKAVVKYAETMGMKVRTVVERAVEEYLGMQRKGVPAKK